jgi:hypothetical protein
MDLAAPSPASHTLLVNLTGRAATGIDDIIGGGGALLNENIFSLIVSPRPTRHYRFSPWLKSGLLRTSFPWFLRFPLPASASSVSGRRRLRRLPAT